MNSKNVRYLCHKNISSVGEITTLRLNVYGEMAVFSEVGRISLFK